MVRFSIVFTLCAIPLVALIAIRILTREVDVSLTLARGDKTGGDKLYAVSAGSGMWGISRIEGVSQPNRLHLETLRRGTIGSSHSEVTGITIRITTYTPDEIVLLPNREVISRRSGVTLERGPVRRHDGKAERMRIWRRTSGRADVTVLATIRPLRQYQSQWIVFPQWLPISLAGVPLAAFVLLAASKWQKRRRRRLAGLCAACGYDLRGSDSARCPECGSPRVEKRRDKGDGGSKRATSRYVPF